MAKDDENILGCESGDWVQPIYEKNRFRKSHATVPLTLKRHFGGGGLFSFYN